MLWWETSNLWKMWRKSLCEIHIDDIKCGGRYDSLVSPDSSQRYFCAKTACLLSPRITNITKTKKNPHKIERSFKSPSKSHSMRIFRKIQLEAGQHLYSAVKMLHFLLSKDNIVLRLFSIDGKSSWGTLIYYIPPPPLTNTTTTSSSVLAHRVRLWLISPERAAFLTN